MIISVSSDEEIEGKSDKYVVIVEWNTVTVGLMWVLSFCWEWKDMNLVLIGPKGENYRHILQEKDLAENQKEVLN